MRRLAAAILVAALLSPREVASQTVVTAATRTRIDATLRAFVDSGKLVGVSALVFEKGREVYFGAFSCLDQEDRVAGHLLDSWGAGPVASSPGR